ncbi:hypothetical protein DFR31_1180 [Alkalispirillum mobile]|uniref:Uncharacterized protein n=1 Tax=Alkalispirillum mobile TaxID=85925 RepID=A0A498CA07_9GAMM|nr:DUF6489 family protein [Alkalispirillum mobile]RLK51256.1 hypothetical protein DFR31_1180 [Alkalispirillum mobile]
MKIRIDIDGKPEELRSFLGLPDLNPVHEALVKQLLDQLEETRDPQALLQKWFAGGVQSAETLQRLILESLHAPAGGPGRSDQKTR